HCAQFASMGQLHKKAKPLSGGQSARYSSHRTKATPKDTQSIQSDRFTRRTVLLGAGGLGLFGLLASKLYNLQNIEGRKYKSLSEDNRTATRFLPSIRGKIYDRTQTLIASNSQNLRVLLIPDKANNVATSLDLLTRTIPVSTRQKQRILRIARQQNPQIPILITDNIGWGQFARINVLGQRIPGIIGDISWRRQYHYGEEFAHIVGHLRPPTDLQLATKPALRLPGTLVGANGIEQGFNEVLQGKSGHQELEVNSRGRNTKTLGEKPSADGADLYLTIDHVLQQRILKRLSPYRRAAVVAIDVNSGDVVAMCSTPTFDPNILTHPIDEKRWRELKIAKDNPLSDKATRGQYPPGSTFKLVTALAALEAGVITPRIKFKCTGAIEWQKHKFHCWNRSGHGNMHLHKALKQSCDVYFYKTARKVGIHRLAAMAHKLGLGEVYDCGLPGQKAGLIPDPDWKQSIKRRIWFGGETMLAGIGQGYVLTTPLQLAVMTARLATGRKVKPRFAHTKDKAPRLVPRKLDINEGSLKLIRKAMTGVINDRDGTGPKAALGWPGLQMAGKTGTSQVRGNRGIKAGKKIEWKYRDHALFVAFAPANNPRYAISVIIEHGKSGGKVAGPVARDVMKMLLIRDPVQRVSHASLRYPARTAKNGSPSSNEEVDL
ncbi:MAG: penicillin-binding protein 2, partial [bacterium]|nr:penicillin-binding protein 2 [bacterium]